MAAVAAVICGPSVVDRLGQYARNPSAGENGGSPRFVWTPGWQVAAVAGRATSRRAVWGRLVARLLEARGLSGLHGRDIGEGAGTSSETGGVWWRGWWRHEICPALLKVPYRRKSPWRICRKRQQGSIEPCPVDGGQVGGSAPEIRLLVKMAAARGVSGGRGGRLWPWSGRASRPSGGLWASGGEAGERSGFVRRCPKSCIAGSRCGAGREHDGRLWDPRFVRASSVAGRPVWVGCPAVVAIMLPWSLGENRAMEALPV